MRTITLLFFLLLSLVDLTAQRTTLLDKNGEIMRGTPLALGRNSALGDTRAAVQDPAWWAAFDTLELNTVRLCYVDPWYDTRPFGPTWTNEEALPWIDAAVENAVANDLNLIINFHNVNGYGGGEDGFDRQLDFWAKVAPRYADNDLVYYELDNEPSFNGNDYLQQEYRDQFRTLYDTVRALAPERHLILFSFNGLGHNMKGIVDSYDYIDWDIATVGWHFYGWFQNDINREQDNLEALLASDYPTICTEWDVRQELNYVRAFYGHDVMAKNLEEFGISWTDWRDWDDASLDEYRDVIRTDAMACGYWWGTVSSVSRVPSLTALPAFPNPASDWFQLGGVAGLTGVVDVTLFDAQGRPVLQQRVQAGVAGIRVELPDLPAGLYVARVVQSGFAGTARVRVR